MFKLSSWKALVVLSVFCLARAVAARAQTLTILAEFGDSSLIAVTPQNALVQGTDGAFYGTSNVGSYDGGAVYRVTATGELTTLYSFCAQTGCPDGKWPFGGLVQGTDGNFYGCTIGGGDANNDGTLFKITPEGQFTTLHVFNGADGSAPTALIQASNGNFYGTTGVGGNTGACTGGCGTFFEYTADGKLTTLYAFNATEGPGPAGLTQASDGNFYGVTNNGGANSCAPFGQGCGTIFKLTPSGTLTTLYTFHGNDGSWPQAGLLQGTDGNFYGTTYYGGASSSGNNPGWGTVFVITPGGQLTTLHSFNQTDGGGPQATVIQATDGNLYGETSVGGPYGVNILFFGAGDGTLFEITPQGELTTLHNFDMTDGAGPVGALIQSPDGNFYGTTFCGAPDDPYNGTFFRLSTGLAPFVKLEPASGEAGAAITILGTDLTGATKVTFNGKAAEFKVVSSTEIAATVPAEASTGKVEVTTPQAMLSSNVPFQVPLHPEVRHGRPLIP